MRLAHMKRRTYVGIMLAVVAVPHGTLAQPVPAFPADDVFSSVAERIAAIELSQASIPPI